jgi:hypothetical protein
VSGSLMERHLEHCPPLTRFSGSIRQVDLSDVDARTRNVFNQFFPEFFRLESSRHFSRRVRTIIEGASVRHGGRGRERRFAGDPSLPRGQYWIVEDTRPNRYRNPLLNELFAYASPWVQVPLRVLDTRLDRSQVKKWLSATQSAVHRESLLQLIPPHFPGALPRSLGIDGSTFTLIKYPVFRQKIAVDGVLDLRQPSAQDWVVAFLCRNVGFFASMVKNNTRAEQRERRWLVALRLLVAQDHGGGQLGAQALGCELRRLGAAGLVFPSARSDSQVVTHNGQILEHRGFNFVDYRGSKLSARSASQAWVIGLPEYPETVSFLTSASRDGTGSWEVRGLQQINAERYRETSIALKQIAENIMKDLCSGKVHPSDYCGNYFMQMAFVNPLFTREEEVASVGQFLVPFTPRRPRTRYGDLEYCTPNWFFIRRSESGMIRLQCVRCLRETVKKKRERPPKRCRSCALGERVTPTEWWPKSVVRSPTRSASSHK